MLPLERYRSYGRIGWLATTFALALALVVGSWLNYRGSRAAVSTLNRGQAELLESAVRDAFPPFESLPDSAALQAFVDSFPQYSITYLAVVDRSGEVDLAVGEPGGAAPSRRELREDFLDLGDRIRVSIPLVHFGSRGAGSLSRGRASRGGVRAAEVQVERDSAASVSAPEAPSTPTFSFQVVEPPIPVIPEGIPDLRNLVVEFEPVVASGLVTRASRSLGLAFLSASILTLAALLFWRTSEQYAAARIRIEEQRRLSQLGEMSAVLAHEIRNPLASLKGTAQLLAEGLPEGSRELKRAGRIVAEAVRLETLTSDLLDFARSGPILREEVDPRELLRDCLAEVEGDGDDAKKVTIDDEAAPERWRLDARRLRHGLVNILQNAVQAEPATAHPVARIARERDDLVIEIRDFGPGLEAGSEERIFDPFFTTRTNGTGLGLAVARRVVEMHGGTITAANMPDGGARFRLVIPERSA